jgi:hypothetical protein
LLFVAQIYNWKPESYNSTDDLPEDMPKGLREHITNVSITEPEKVIFLKRPTSWYRFSN